MKILGIVRRKKSCKNRAADVCQPNKFFFQVTTVRWLSLRFQVSILTKNFTKGEKHHGGSRACCKNKGWSAPEFIVGDADIRLCNPVLVIQMPILNLDFDDHV